MTTGRVVVLRGDARALPLPDASVDLIATSPPFYALRSYTDGGEHYAEQVGSEPTWQEYIAALLDCTREWKRVLKPDGSMFIELGDKYAGSGPGSATTNAPNFARHFKGGRTANNGYRAADTASIPTKSLMDLPHRYSIACVDELGLIKRSETVWHHTNGLPESVTDRVRRAHSMVFHFTRLPRYYSAVDEIREPHEHDRRDQWDRRLNHNGQGPRASVDARVGNNPLGKLPGSVWDIPSQPLTVPAHLGVDHFAAYPFALVRPIVLGWSPPGVCVACGQGRRPVVVPRPPIPPEVPRHRGHGADVKGISAGSPARVSGPRIQAWNAANPLAITGYVCACTPHTDHPGTGEPGNMPHGTMGNVAEDGRYAGSDRLAGLGGRIRTGPWREYHHDAWTPPPTRPAVVLDPFAGTGTTMLVAAALGRIGIGVDRSADYTRLAQWRCNDPGERAKALQVPKPPPVPDGMEALF